MTTRELTPEPGDLVWGTNLSGTVRHEGRLQADAGQYARPGESMLIDLDDDGWYVETDTLHVIEKADGTRPFTGEVRVVSETGGEKGKKPAELAAVDPKALLVLAEVAGRGAEKYAPFNYLKGYDWSLSMNALLRHTLAFWNGEDNDPETGLPHMAHAAWHGLALTSFLVRGLGTDDRFKGGAV